MVNWTVGLPKTQFHIKTLEKAYDEGKIWHNNIFVLTTTYATSQLLQLYKEHHSWAFI